MKKRVLLGFLLLTSLLWAQKGVNIIVNTGLPEAAVFLDGEYIGITGPDGKKIIQDVPGGEHKIRIAKNGYLMIRQTVTVSELDNNFTFTMKKNPGYQPNPGNNKPGPANAAPPAARKTGGSSPVNLDFLLVVMVILVMAIVLFMMVWIIRKSKKHTVIGKFELLRLIGKGGIASIYKAKDLVQRKIVALKVLDPTFITDGDLVYKFFREGDAISKINEEFPDAPVVKVSEFGRDREKSLGIPFIAMELVKGRDLLKIIEQDKKETNPGVPVTQKLHIAREVARGLNAAHKLGIFHGDITPDNIIVDGEKVTLIDFGVSLQQRDNYKNMDASVNGKPVYMSPEQCEGKPIDEKSDVYSLGIILFFLFSGSPPFISKNPLEIMTMHQEKPLPEPETPVPDNIKDLIFHMLDKDPRERPGTTELEETLANLIREYEIK